jgi:predicted nucleotidyltransferase
MRTSDLQIDTRRLAELCEEYGVACLEVFGSFVRGDVTPGSDLDILVTVEPGAKGGLRIVALHQALEEFFDHPVDLLTRAPVRAIARQVLPPLCAFGDGICSESARPQSTARLLSSTHDDHHRDGG